MGGSRLGNVKIRMACQVPPDVSTHHAEALDKAVADLKYGSINVNVATMLGFCVPKLTWGAYPGNTPQARAHPPDLASKQHHLDLLRIVLCIASSGK